MKKIAILGSTGSIGTQTLEVVRENKDIKVLGLAAGSNIELLEKQIREFSPKVVAVWKEEKAKELKTKIADLDVRVVSGMDGLIEVSVLEDVEILVTAIVGMIGIRPTVEAIRAGKDIALANKETLVTAGHIIMPLAKENHVSILPVDSEHSAIFQSLQGNDHGAIHKILLTEGDIINIHCQAVFCDEAIKLLPCVFSEALESPYRLRNVIIHLQSFRKLKACLPRLHRVDNIFLYRLHIFT